MQVKNTIPSYKEQKERKLAIQEVYTRIQKALYNNKSGQLKNIK